MKKIVVTGAGGFVGRRLMELDRERYQLVPLSLRDKGLASADFRGVEAIVHLAGKAHDMGQVPDQVYYSVNLDLTRALAEKALAQGVPFLIYMSSVKVYGDALSGPVDESSPCQPTDAYGGSKLAAENFLLSLSRPGFEVAIIRPPVVYGPGVKGNILRLLGLAAKKIPLPLGRTGNARSMVYIDNLLALVNCLLDRPRSGIFIAGDARPLATDELIGLIRLKMGRGRGLVSLPAPARALIKKLRPALHQRLFGSLVVDNGPTNHRLGFNPPVSSEAGIESMVRWFLQNRPAAGGGQQDKQNS